MAAIKHRPLHQQVTDQMRRTIQRGQWAPGTQIPTEDQLCGLYEVSRPTVRLAVQALRTEGLLSVEQGRGTFVRAPSTTDRTTLDRTITGTAQSYNTQGDDWTDVEPPDLQRVTLDPVAAALLELATGEAAFLVTRLLAHTAQPPARVRQTILIPLETATGTPLAQPGGKAITASCAFSALAAQHGPLEWVESVSARQPTPDERAALHTDGAPLLITRRITRTQAERRPLMLETTSLPADAVELSYTLRPTRRTRVGK
ncbi:GntR family transcriptional regulator [Streptacidiphilus sp. 4-A2]|nr:GntR family transcriptional regulator [Streptacidiphilus sp. 4-A2]